MNRQFDSDTITLLMVVGDRLELLPHTLAHYKALGVDQMLLWVHQHGPNDAFIADCREITKRFDATILDVSLGAWKEEHNQQLFHDFMRNHPDHWFLITDVDELQLYPMPLSQVVQLCNQHDAHFVNGLHVDRTTKEGLLTEVLPTPSLWEQFPVASSVANLICSANPLKITLCKGVVKVGIGQHRTVGTLKENRKHSTTQTALKGLDRNLVMAQVHHFRWTAALTRTLEQRCKRFSNDPSLLQNDAMLHEAALTLEILKEGRLSSFLEMEQAFAELINRADYDAYLKFGQLVSCVNHEQHKIRRPTSLRPSPSSTLQKLKHSLSRLLSD